MAYAHVQTVASNAQTASKSVTITAGSLVVVTLMFSTGGGATGATVTTNTAASFTAGPDSGAGGGYRCRSYYLENAGSGITSVSITLDNSAGEYGFVVSEYSGIATSSSLVGSVGTNQSAPGVGTDAITSGNTGTLSSQPALFYGFAFSNGYAAASAGTGFSSRITSAFGGNLCAEDKRVTVTTADDATFTTVTGAADTWNVLAMAFAEAAAGGSSFPPVPESLLLKSQMNAMLVR